MVKKSGDFSDKIKAYALKNAVEFGKADVGKIISKLFQHGLEKKDIKKIMPKVLEIVKEVNSLSSEEKEKAFVRYFKHVKIRKEKEKGLPELPEVKGKPVFRVAPFPSGALHLGNAKTFLLNAMYSEKYKGKLILVMDDTIGSAEKQIDKDSYELIKEAFKWLGIKYAGKIYYKSDRLKIYYDFAEELIRKGKAYVCECERETLRENRVKGIECSCRQYNIKEQLKRWKEMFDRKQGEAVLRIKTNMMDSNPAFRDRVLFRISEREHPRVKKKYKVWPTLEMSWAIDDHLLGITHIIRGNDLMIESDMEKFIWDVFKWKHPVIIHTGLINIGGIGPKISKSKAQKEVRSGKFLGWDDPRTWSIQSLERRGFKKKALREFVKQFGIKNQDITIPIESLYAINRKLIDSTSNRYSFVENELKLNMGVRTREIKVPVHPDKKKTRKIKVKKSIFISKKDFKKFKGKEIRLIHLNNVKLSGRNTSKVTSLENKDIPKINWVSGGVKCRILMPLGIWVDGIAEEGIKELKIGDIIQFERFGFCRFDKKNKNVYEFWFAHK